MAEALVVNRTYTGAAGRYQAELAELDETNLADYPRAQELGTLHLEPVVDRLRVIRDLVGGLDGQGEMLLSAKLLDEVKAHLDATLDYRNRGRDLTLETPDAASRRAQIIQGIEEERDWFARNLTPLTGLNRGDPNASLRAIEQSRQTAEVAAAEAERIKGEAQRIVDEMRPLAAEVAVQDFASRYRAQAETYATAARIFLVVAVAGGLLATVAVVGVVPWVDLGNAESVNLSQPNALVALAIEVSPRLFLVGAALYVARFGVRNYALSRHLQVIYEHRKNALETFPLFAESASTAEGRTSVLLELVRAVATEPVTGYVGGRGGEARIELPGGVKVAADAGDH